MSDDWARQVPRKKEGKAKSGGAPVTACHARSAAAGSLEAWAGEAVGGRRVVAEAERSIWRVERRVGEAEEESAGGGRGGTARGAAAATAVGARRRAGATAAAARYRSAHEGGRRGARG